MIAYHLHRTYDLEADVYVAMKANNPWDAWRVKKHQAAWEIEIERSETACHCLSIASSLLLQPVTDAETDIEGFDQQFFDPVDLFCRDVSVVLVE